MGRYSTASSLCRLGLRYDDHGKRASDLIQPTYPPSHGLLEFVHILCLDLRDDIVDAVSRGEPGSGLETRVHNHVRLFHFLDLPKILQDILFCPDLSVNQYKSCRHPYPSFLSASPIFILIGWTVKDFEENNYFSTICREITVNYTNRCEGDVRSQH